MITLEDILKIDNTDFYYYLKYGPYGKDDIHYPETNHIYWSDIRRMDGRNTKDTDLSDVLLIPKYLQFGDYDNSCMVERSNKKLFLEEYSDQPFVFEISGGYGSEGIAISVKELLNQDNEEKALEIIELLNGLNDYPCIDDEDMSNMEYDAFIESFNDYGYKDAMDALSKKFNLDIYDYKEEEFKALLLEHDSRGNPSWMIESGGSCYIDIDELIKDITLDELKPLLTDYESRT